MLDGVELLGIAQSVVMQGPDGPFNAETDSRNPLVVFRFLGWEPENEEGGPEDEGQGHYLMRAMESFGNGLADGKMTPTEAVNIVAAAYPKFKHAKLVELAISTAEDVFRALSDDGKLTWNESLTIAVSVFRKLSSTEIDV